MDRLVLVHSPLTGPETWLAVAAELRNDGLDVLTPSLAGVFDGPGPFYRAIGDAVAAQVRPIGPTCVLVAHSGAGALLPAAAGALVSGGTAVRGAIFVDAILPHPGESWLAGAPPELAAKISTMAGDGHVPPWSEWFPDAVAAQLPDPEARTAFTSTVPRLPYAYFEEAAPVVSIWPPAHQAYIRLSEAYRTEAETARQLGWPVTEADVEHLAPFTRPAEVADLIARAFSVIMTG